MNSTGRKLTPEFESKTHVVKFKKYIFSSKTKTSETAKTHKKLVATVSRCEGVYNRTDEPRVTFCERGGTV